MKEMLETIDPDAGKSSKGWVLLDSTGSLRLSYIFLISKTECGVTYILPVSQSCCEH